MLRFRHAILIAVAAAQVALSVRLGADEPKNALDQNRELLEKAKSDSEHYARLCRDLQTFLALPPEKQDDLRRLELDLQAEKPQVQLKYRRVMERYITWLASLPEEERRRIEDEPNPANRLVIIKEIRQRQYIGRLPRAFQDQILAATALKRVELIKQFRLEENSRQNEWELAIRNWDRRDQDFHPKRLADFPLGVQNFFHHYLEPHLTRTEKDKLQELEGTASYPQTMVALADKHLSAVLPGPVNGPKRWLELPAGLQKLLKERRPGARLYLRSFEGQWPEYAIKVSEFAQRNHISLAKELGPCKPEDFLVYQSINRFIHWQLNPLLTSEEKAVLKSAEGHWPLYPQTLVRLGRDHHLYVPGTVLPGPKNYWDQFRVAAKSKDRGSPGP